MTKVIFMVMMICTGDDKASKIAVGIFHKSSREVVMCRERCRILVVDDSADNLFMLKIVLEEEGYEVELADSGSSALVKIFAAPPDLVLLDMMMPQMNGIEVTQRLRQHDQLKELPIVLITAYEEEVMKQGLNVGANGCLGKPVNFEELLQKVRVFCEI